MPCARTTITALFFFSVFEGDVGLALVIADLVDAVRQQLLHHLAVVDERPVGVNLTVGLDGEFARDVNGTLDAPAKAGALGTDNLHAPDVRAESAPCQLKLN